MNFPCSHSGLITTTARKLDREIQDEHDFEASVKDCEREMIQSFMARKMGVVALQ